MSWGPDFPQVACADRPVARHAEGLRAGRPAINRHESHVARLGAKQARAANTRQEDLSKMCLHGTFNAQPLCARDSRRKHYQAV